VSGASVEPAAANPPAAIGRKISLGFLVGQPEPTVVHRQPIVHRPSLLSFSLERAMKDAPINDAPSIKSTSTSADSSGIKSSPPRLGDSTGMTSLESSKTFVTLKGVSSPSSENKQVQKQIITKTPERVSDPLMPILEIETVEVPAPAPSMLEYFQIN
jgi:hypothetical protein